MVYAPLSPDVHRILTAERGWTADRYQRWIARTLSTLLRTGPRPPASPDNAAEPGSPGHAATKGTRRQNVAPAVRTIFRYALTDTHADHNARAIRRVGARSP
jgi:hypothetical protein